MNWDECPREKVSVLEKGKGSLWTNLQCKRDTSAQSIPMKLWEKKERWQVARLWFNSAFYQSEGEW